MRAQREEVQLLEEGVDILRPTRQSSPEPKDIRGVRKGARAPSDRRKIGDGNTRKDRSRYNRAGGYEGVSESKDGGYNSSRSRDGKTRICYRSIRRVRRRYNPDPGSIRRRYARIDEMQRGIRA